MWYPKCESLRKPSWVQIWSNMEVMSLQKTSLLSASILAFVPTITLHFAKKHMHKNQLILKDKGNTQNSSVTDALSMILSVDLYPCQKRNTAPCGTLRAWSIKGISPWKVRQESHKMVKRPSFPYGMAWLVTNVAWPLFALQWFVWCTPVYQRTELESLTQTFHRPPNLQDVMHPAFLSWGPYVGVVMRLTLPFVSSSPCPHIIINFSTTTPHIINFSTTSPHITINFSTTAPHSTINFSTTAPQHMLSSSQMSCPITFPNLALTHFTFNFPLTIFLVILSLLLLSFFLILLCPTFPISQAYIASSIFSPI